MLGLRRPARQGDRFLPGRGREGWRGHRPCVDRLAFQTGSRGSPRKDHGGSADAAAARYAHGREKDELWRFRGPARHRRHALREEDMTASFSWYELMTTDTDAAIDFYADVVGWTAADHPNSAGGVRYPVLSAGESGVGGVLQLDEAMKQAGVKPMWVGYVGVADTDDVARRIKEAGGAIHVPPMDIPSVGRFTMASDPAGAPFYAMTPLPRDDIAHPGLDTPGHVSWRELYSSTGEKAAFDFYSGLFGWQTMMEMPMGPMGTYRIFGDGTTQWGGGMNNAAALRG